VRSELQLQVNHARSPHLGDGVLHQAGAQAFGPVLIQHIQLIDLRDRAAEFETEQIRRQQIAA